MGAGRARIIRQLLTESIVLSLTGGILGLILGYAGVRALLAVSPAGLPRIGEHGAAVGVDWRVLLSPSASPWLTGILFGLFPAIGASRPDLNSYPEGKQQPLRYRASAKARPAPLVIGEVSLALVLLIGAALLIRTFIALRRQSRLRSPQRPHPRNVPHRRRSSKRPPASPRSPTTDASASMPSPASSLRLHLLPASRRRLRPALQHHRPRP
jgi:hypothetical protein